MKKLLFTAFTIFALANVNAQISFSHAGGAKYLSASTSSSDESVDAIGVLYSPRLNLFEVADNSTVSVGSHISLAFEGSTNSRTGGSSSFVYDIPLVVEYNFGMASNSDNDEGFGFYVGGGYSIFNSSVISDTITGPVANGGVRFMVGDFPLDLNVSYMFGSDDVNVLGIGIQYVLGL